MNIVLKYRVLLTLLILIVVASPVSVFAQPGFDPGVPDGAPIDGGLSMLAVAGVMYGVNKFVNKGKKNQEGDENNESLNK